MEFSVKVPDGKGGKTPLWRAIPEWAGTSREITATGRRWGEGEYFSEDPMCCTTNKYPPGKLTLYNANDNIRYRVGQTRAICPSRTGAGVWYRKSLSTTPGTIGCKPIEYAHELQFEHTTETYAIGDKSWLSNMGFHPARLRITSLQKLDVRRMTDEQAQRAGFESAGEYLDWWARQYDVQYRKLLTRLSEPLSDWKFDYSPDELYICVYIGFEFIEVE